jgi:hypothetical protein
MNMNDNKNMIEKINYHYYTTYALAQTIKTLFQIFKHLD